MFYIHSYFVGKIINPLSYFIAMAPSFESGSSILIAVFCCLITSKIVWEFLFSPLRHFPGPIAARFTNFYRAFVVYLGHIDKRNINWHRKYGTAVRIGPNTISFSDPSLIGIIYATKNAWLKVVEKNSYYFICGTNTIVIRVTHIDLMIALSKGSESQTSSVHWIFRGTRNTRLQSGVFGP